MFHKEHSSTCDQGGKKGKDVALRKSDRRSLLHKACAVLQILPRSATENNNSSLLLLLEVAFLKGTLLKRTLKLGTTNHHVSLYFRSANESVVGDVSAIRRDGDSAVVWPFSLQQQCIWLQVEQERGVVLEIPGVALLAALLPTASNSKYQFPAMVTVPCQVSKFVCRGANIMRAGMLNVPTSTTAKGGVVAVCVLGNPQPFGVGVLHPDLMQNATAAQSMIGPGTKGTGVTMLHAYGDDIWRQQLPTAGKNTFTSTNTSAIVNLAGGSDYDAGHYGNVGFVDGQYVAPIHALPDDGDEPLNEPDPTVSDADDATGRYSPSFDPGDAVTIDPNSPTSETVMNATTMDETNLVSNKEISDHDLSSPTADKAVTATTRSAEEVLHDAVCTALASLSLKRDLPMTMATFYAQHVLPNRSATIQLKQTRYKKFSSYVAEQVEAGLIMAGPDAAQKDPLGMLKGYDVRHSDLVKYLEARQASMNGRKSNNNDDDSSMKRLVLADLYCIPNHFVALLRLDRDAVKAVNATAAERCNTGMLTVKEVRVLLDDYISREELVTADRPDQVLLDGPLTDVLFKKKKKQGTDTSNDPTPTTLPRKDLMALWLACQEPAYALVQVPGNAILKLGRGKPPVVTIEVSRRQSNKFVTRVFGLKPFGVDAAAFAKDVAHRFACSAIVTPPATANAPEEVLIQGNLADELEALLLSDESLTTHGGAKGSTYQLPKNSLDIVLRKGVPARKKRNVGSKKQK
jgi:translation initiation factor 1 (eIF-1/SUI1)/predicted ribosome-associated RNA-binding protein Tma20